MMNSCVGDQHALIRSSPRHAEYEEGGRRTSGGTGGVGGGMDCAAVAKKVKREGC